MLYAGALLKTRAEGPMGGSCQQADTGPTKSLDAHVKRRMDLHRRWELEADSDWVDDPLHLEWPQLLQVQLEREVL